MKMGIQEKNGRLEADREANSRVGGTQTSSLRKLDGHHPGSKQVKACYVDEFVDVMIDIGLYDE